MGQHPKRWIAVLGAVALLGGLGLIVALSSGSEQAAAAPYSALNQPQGPESAPEDPNLQVLARQNHKLQLEQARRVIADSKGSVWVTTATNGDICLLESVSDSAAEEAAQGMPLIVRSRFACSSAQDAAKQGVIGGVPGNFYGIAPDGAQVRAATSVGSSERLYTTNNAFRVPPQATSVVVGDHRHNLPTLPSAATP